MKTLGIEHAIMIAVKGFGPSGSLRRRRAAPRSEQQQSSARSPAVNLDDRVRSCMVHKQLEANSTRKAQQKSVTARRYSESQARMPQHAEWLLPSEKVAPAHALLMPSLRRNRSFWLTRRLMVRVTVERCGLSMSRGRLAGRIGQGLGFCLRNRGCSHGCISSFTCTCSVRIRNKYVRIRTGGIRTYLCMYFRVRICTYYCPYCDMYFCPYLDVYWLYLHVSQFVSARIPVRICTYLNSYTVSECIVLYTSKDLHVSRAYPGSYLLVPCLCLHLQFNARSAKHRPRRPARLPHTHIHNHPRTVTHPRSLCRLRVSAGALPAPRRQP